MKNSIKTTLILFAIFCIGFNTKTTLAQGHQGIYVKYKMTFDTIDGSMEVYYLDGNTRFDSFYVSGNKSLPNLKTLSLKDSADIEYLLYESNKTYKTLSMKLFKTKTKNDEYEITVLGKENADNFNCIHIKIVNKTRNKEQEIWTSKEVMDYSFFKNIKDEHFGSSNMFKALEAKGADGFIVKALHGKITLNLLKAEKRVIDMSMFSLDGYTRKFLENNYENQK